MLNHFENSIIDFTNHPSRIWKQLESYYKSLRFYYSVTHSLLLPIEIHLLVFIVAVDLRLIVLTFQLVGVGQQLLRRLFDNHASILIEVHSIYYSLRLGMHNYLSKITRVSARAEWTSTNDLMIDNSVVLFKLLLLGKLVHEGLIVALSGID